MARHEQPARVKVIKRMPYDQKQSWLIILLQILTIAILWYYK